MKKPVTTANAIERLEALCCRSEQCSGDMRRKLLTWGITGSRADDIINRLTEHGFVDDRRFACAYARDKYRFNGWGRNKIITALIARRIPKSHIEEALGEIDTRQYAMAALKALSGKLKTIPSDTPLHETRQKLYRFGLQRGYESVLITRIINSRKLWLTTD